MSVLQRFKAGLKQALETASNTKYAPKFAVGDVLFCKKFESIRRILSIEELKWDKSGNNTLYKMENVKTHAIAIKEAAKIDWAYEKVNEKAITVLYGKK